LANRNSFTDSIEFNTDIQPQDGTVEFIEVDFSIKVTARGGAFAWKNVSARIVVCGWERVSLVEDERVLYEFHYTIDPQQQIYPLASNFTTNDTDCPVIDYSIKKFNRIPPSAIDDQDDNTRQYFTLVEDNTKLYMQPGLSEQYWYFFILAETVSGRYVYKSVAISVTA
jgi:hypothetical protein